MPIPPVDESTGYLGTFFIVDDMGTVFVNWDNDSGLGCVLTEDRIKIVY